jgi:hypothetical protein
MDCFNLDKTTVPYLGRKCKGVCLAYIWLSDNKTVNIGDFNRFNKRLGHLIHFLFTTR